MPQYVELKVGGIKVALFLRLQALFEVFEVCLKNIKCDLLDCHMTVWVKVKNVHFLTTIIKNQHISSQKDAKCQQNCKKNCKKTVKLWKIVREASAKPQFSRSSNFRGQLRQAGASTWSRGRTSKILKTGIFVSFLQHMNRIHTLLAEAR